MQAVRPQLALGGCGDSTQKILRASKCKSQEQPLCFCPAPHSRLAAPSLPPVVLALMKLTIHNSFICARWAGCGLSVYQPINLGPGMTSLYGLSESKGRPSSSYVKISYGNRENW